MPTSASAVRRIPSLRYVREPTETFVCTLRKLIPLRRWDFALRAAGELDSHSHGLTDPYPEVQASVPAREAVCHLVKFGDFFSSERIAAYATAVGFTPAHPRIVAALAEKLPDLPLRLGRVGAPLSVASLVSCYREEGEEFVMSVSWERKGNDSFARKVRGVYYNYGWEPYYWFVFVDKKQQAAVR